MTTFPLAPTLKALKVGRSCGQVGFISLFDFYKSLSSEPVEGRQVQANIPYSSFFKRIGSLVFSIWIIGHTHADRFFSRISFSMVFIRIRLRASNYSVAI